MEGIKKYSLMALVFASILLLSASYVSAFGIVMPYWEGRPLVLSPGESKDVVIKLQNVEEGDITVEVKLVSGGEVATIIDGSNIYNIPKGTTNTLINLNVVIPDGAAVGSSHEVSLSIKDVSDKSGGMVHLTTSIAKSFKVEVVAKSPELPKVESPKEPERTLLLPMIMLCLVIILVVLMFLMLVVHFRNKNKKAAAKTRKGKGMF